MNKHMIKMMMMSVFLMVATQTFAQKLLDAAASGGPLSFVVASSGGVNTSITVAYSMRQLKTTYDHAAITPPSAVSGFTNANQPLLRVRRGSDNEQLDIGYLVSGMLDTVTLKSFTGSGSGFVSVWYDQSGNSRDAIQATTNNQPRIVNSGVLDVNESGVPGFITLTNQWIADGSVYGITGDRTLKVVCQPKTYTNASIISGGGTYAIDRNPLGGGNPLTSIKTSSDKWGLQIRTDAGTGLGSSFEGSTSVNVNRTDNLTAIRSGDVYTLEVNGISVGSATVSGVNTMDPIKMGYGSGNTEAVYYGEVILFGSALSSNNKYALHNNQNAFFKVGGGYTWTGATSTDWNTASNWSNNNIPDEAASVTIPSGTTHALVITSGQTTLKAYKFTVNSGATVTINGNLSVTDSVNSNGTMNGTGTLTLSGIYKQYIKGTLCGLINNNTTETVYASGNTSVSGTLVTAINSTLDMSAYTLYGALTTITNNGTIKTSSTANPALGDAFNWGGTGTVEYALTTGGQTLAMGTYTNLKLSNTSGTNTVSAAGNIAITGTLTTTAGGTLNMLTGQITAVGIIVNSGTISTTNNSSTPLPTGKSWGGTIVYGATSGTQTIVSGTYTNLTLNNTGGTNTASGNLTINGTLYTAAGGSLDMLTYIIDGTITGSSNNGTIKTMNTSSTPMPTGKSWGGTIEYNASATQTVSNGTYTNLTLTNSSKNAGGNLVVNGTLLKDNIVLDLGVYTLSGTLTGISNNNGVILTANTSANPIPSGKNWGTASWLIYNASSGGQTVVGATSTHLYMQNNSGTQTVSGDLSIDQRLIIPAGVTLNMGAYTLSGQITSIELSGTLSTSNTSATPIPAGKNWSYVSTSTINYNAATGGQTVVNGTYRNLTMGNTSGTQTTNGNVTVNGTLTTAAGGIFNLGTNTLSGTLSTITNDGTISTSNTTATPFAVGKTWGGNGTVKYAVTTGGQTIVSGTYGSLLLSNTSNINTAGGDIGVNGTLTTQSGGTFDLGTYQMTGASSSIANSGTIKTASTSLSPLPTSKTWGGTVNYYATTGGQTIAGGTYNNLILSNSSGTNTANGAVGADVNFTVPSGATLDMSIYRLWGPMSGTLSMSGTLKTANTEATAIPTLKTWGGTVEYNNASGGQYVANGTYNNLKVSNTSGVQTAWNNLTINGTLTTTTGATLALNTYTIGGSLSTITNNGTISTSNTSASPLPTGKTWAGTINYNSATGGQTIVQGTYTNLMMGNTSGSQSPTNSLTVNGTLTTTAGGILDMGTRSLTGSLASIVNNGTIRTSSTSGSALPDGVTWSGTVEYSASAGAQTIADGTYNNLILSNTGGTQTAHGNTTVNNTLTITAGGILDMGTRALSGTLSIINNDGTIKTSNTSAAPLASGKTWGGSGTVLYAVATGGQTIVDGTYNNLTSGNNSGTNTASGNLVVNGTLSVFSGGTMSMSAYTLSGTLGTINLSGALTTANTSTTPLPSGKTWGGLVRYNAALGGQTVVSATSYAILTMNNISGTQTAAGNINVTGTLSTAAGGTLSMGAYMLAVTGSVSNSGTIATANTSSTPLPTGRTWAGTIKYNTASGGQTVVAGTYNNLTLENTSGTQTASGDLTMSNGGTLLTTTGGTLDMGVNVLSESGTATFTNNGTILLYNTSPTPIPANKIWGGTIGYQGSNMSIITGTYNILTLNCSSGTETATGDIVVNSVFTHQFSGDTLNMGNYTLSVGSTVFNNGVIATSSTANPPLPSGKNWVGTGTLYYTNSTGGQYIVAAVTTNLKLGNTSGIQTVTGGGLTIDGTLTIPSGATLDMATYAMAGSLTGVVNSGTIMTANTTSNPFPAGKTWGGVVHYNAVGGGQTISNGTYHHLLMGNTEGIQSLSGATTVNGSITLSGGKLALGSNTLTLNGTFIGHNATASLVANGSSNLSIGGAGTLGSSLFFDQTTPGTTNRLNDFTYNRASQTITLGNAMQVIGTITPTAGLLATNDMLTLASTATATGRIGNGSGAYITGNVIAERFIPSVARRFRFMASPVNGTTLADWKNEIYITGAGGTANGFDSTATNAPSVYYYDESIPGDNNANGWVAAPNANVALTPGKGFRVFIRGDRSDATVLNGSSGVQAAVTMNAVGPVNTGNVTMPVSYTNSGNSAYDGWSLVGNPYPSPIDWDVFHDAGRTGSAYDYTGTDYTHLDAVIYLYDPAVNGYTSFNAFSGAHTGSMTNGVIPSGGAFWVKAAASPLMTMKEIYKTGTLSTAAIFKKEAEQKQFSIKLVSNADSKLYDEAAIKYVNEATSGCDAYDIRKLFGAEVNIASIGTDASLLSANYKPFNGQSDSIMLSIGMLKSGSYRLEFNDPSILVTGIPVYLIDLYAQRQIRIGEGVSYAFTVDVSNPQTKGNNRFMIWVGDLKPMQTAVTEMKLSEGPVMYPALTDGKVTIHNYRAVDESVTVIIRDAAGSEVGNLQNLKWNQNEISVDLSGNRAGSYVLTVQSHSGTSVFKCIKY